MALELCHPEVAALPCSVCRGFIILEKTWELDRTSDGQPIRRPSIGINKDPPCKQPRGQCPKGSYDAKRSLDPQNEQAYRHYLECKAVGRFPPDAIVRENAGVIREVEERVERDGQKMFREMMAELMTFLAAKAKL